MSPMNMNQERNVDHEKIKCRTNMAEKSNALCHAWNLPLVSTITGVIDEKWYVVKISRMLHSPNIVTLLFHNEKEHSSSRRQ